MGALPLLLPFCFSLVGGSDDGGREMIRVAREAVIAEVSGAPVPKTPRLGSPQPVFVTIERGGKVVGCRGSLMARRADLGAEIADAARAAAAHDPRYRPLTTRDLKDFLVTVTVVSRLETIPSVDGLLPDDGLALIGNGKTGIVLPWEGKDPQVRLKWAYRKAGLPEGSSATLQRVVAERWRG